VNIWEIFLKFSHIFHQNKKYNTSIETILLDIMKNLSDYLIFLHTFPKKYEIRNLIISQNDRMWNYMKFFRMSNIFLNFFQREIKKFITSQNDSIIMRNFSYFIIFFPKTSLIKVFLIIFIRIGTFFGNT
jgi:hypothetical protein